jgi:hypothetical protein
MNHDATVADPPESGERSTATAEVPPAQAETSVPADAPVDDHAAELKRLDAMRQLGEAIRQKDRERDMQESEVADVEADLKRERGSLNKILAELEEMKDDLTTLSVGGHLDKLPFAGTVAGNAAKTMGDADAPTTPDAWRSVPVADVGFHVKTVEALTAVELTTLGKLADYLARNKWTDVKGIGEKKGEAAEDALINFWATHPEYGHDGKRDATPTSPAPLDWHPGEGEFSWVATAACEDDGGGCVGNTWEFRIDMLGDGLWTVSNSDAEVMPADGSYPESFDGIDAAKAWLADWHARFMAEVAAPPALEWSLPKDGHVNAIAESRVRTGEYYRVQGVNERWGVNLTDSPLLPPSYPDRFRTKAEAVAFCEEREAAHARDAATKAEKAAEAPATPSAKPAKTVKNVAKKAPPRKTAGKKK